MASLPAGPLPSQLVTFPAALHARWPPVGLADPTVARGAASVTQPRLPPTFFFYTKHDPLRVPLSPSSTSTSCLPGWDCRVELGGAGPGAGVSESPWSMFYYSSRLPIFSPLPSPPAACMPRMRGGMQCAEFRGAPDCHLSTSPLCDLETMT